MQGNRLTFTNVRENNLKGFDLTLQHDQLIVITGVSGSGKSTLAFDTIYTEGARRYIETFSPYTRQFLDRLHQPKVDNVSGVRPALALEQRNRTTSSRSTVGTVTEVNDYLKVLWANLASLICPTCKEAVLHYTPSLIADTLLQSKKTGVALICFLLPFRGESTAGAYLSTLIGEGFVRAVRRSNLSVVKLEEISEADLRESGGITVVVERLRLSGDAAIPPDRALKERVAAACAQAYHYGRGTLSVIYQAAEPQQWREETYSDSMQCRSCGSTFPPPRAATFTFNSPLGACDRCNGFGKILEITPNVVIPDSDKSIDQGAIVCWNSKATKWEFKRLKKVCLELSIPSQVPWSELKQSDREFLFYGGKRGKTEYEGVSGWFEWLKTRRHKMHVRVFLARYRSELLCPDCQGGRLKNEALCYELAGLTLPQVWQLPIDELLPRFESLHLQLVGDEVSEIALGEVVSRLRYLRNIGLPYLTLDRQTRTLSGGESQRVNLTSILGSRLVHTTLVLDEPTIGLHPRDTNRLIEALRALRARGNTVVVVEHEPAMIRAADEILDLGPGSGAEGGKIVFQGRVAHLAEASHSLTGQYLAGKLPVTRSIVGAGGEFFSLRGARANNLKRIDVSFPAGALTAVTGVSGSGKSSLVKECLFDHYQRAKTKGRAQSPSILFPEGDLLDCLEGFDAIDDVILVDQTPPGKTPRSNPGTYTGVWDVVRECLAETPDAQRLGLSKSSFSFNVKGGRCPSCEGSGSHKIEMQFLADVYVECESCGGSRFKDAILSVRFAGKNVEELLGLSLAEVAHIFQGVEGNSKAVKVCALLSPLLTLGLGYLRLGQSLSDVSGGEAQRIKLASYLKESGKKKFLFILDEPTTGLHPQNINGLLRAFDSLLAAGHTILCVEHNQDLIRLADYLIDLGPEGGEAGGRLVLQGSRAELVSQKKAVEKSLTLRELMQPQNIAQLPKSERENHRPQIVVRGAREHNLKNLSAEIAHNSLTVITGVSGSGKSTFAFDILFQEGQRRYIDCLSPYARQYITEMHRAEVDLIEGVPPTVAVSQKTAPPVGISTIATTTEVYTFLRLLFAKVGEQRCPEHDLPIVGLSAEAIAEAIVSQAGEKRLFIYAPVVEGRKGSYNDLFQRALRAELEEARIDGKMVRLTPELRLERHKLHWISLLVASLSSAKKNRELVKSAVEQALLLGTGTVEIALEKRDAKPLLFSNERVCPKCRRGFRALDPQDFSFRSARGACGGCGGRGYLGTEDEQDDTPRQLCSECKGSRLGEIGRSVYVGGRKIYEYAGLSATALAKLLPEIRFEKRLDPIVQPILHELSHRLGVIRSVGLDYLQLDRESSSVSGGEAQRLRLARALGSPLSGVCYILDEPTIGLHPADHQQLMQTLCQLRDSGNTVIVVEHDELTIIQGDRLIDFGPAGGAGGGRIVASGTVREVMASEFSVTGRALASRLAEASNTLLKAAVVTKLPALMTEPVVSLKGACKNNLKDVTIEIPHAALTVVCGISGAGKSSLVHGTLVPALTALFEEERVSGPSWQKIAAAESLQRLIEIDQTPIGKTSTSTPASYLGIFDDIRKIFATLPEALLRGWSASHFSFNSGKGRCETCGGRGYLKIPMSFLPDAEKLCESCNGLRYNDFTREVMFQGLSIGEILQKTFVEAREIFGNHAKVRRLITYVNDLGIGYLTLGQPTHTLSGGEAQRLKIAAELGARDAVNTLYILDEPTVGLHMTDVERLLNVLRQLIARGNSVVVIEHDLDVIAAADKLLELGPGPGERGGKLLFSGSPAALLRGRYKTATATALRRRSEILRETFGAVPKAEGSALELSSSELR